MTASKLASDKEKELAEQLRRQCYSNGREIDILKTSKVLYELGLLYKEKFPDKISVIQSVALLNAAAIRDANNAAIKHDIAQVCSQVLTAAGAVNTKADLIQTASDVKRKFVAMRQAINTTLTKSEFIPGNIVFKHFVETQIQKIKFIKTLQNQITKDYIQIMSGIADQCLHILGDPPFHARYSLVGMGSLARKEVTPYSDFESFIVFEDGLANSEQTVEYFRWFAVIFQVILINLGETILPSVAIPSLNNFTEADGDWFYDAYTTCGVSSDGMMPHASKNPLGRQLTTKTKQFKTELIKPVQKMLCYLDHDEDLKNGYHLAEILTRSCHVHGDKKIYEQFVEGVDEKLTQQKRKQQFNFEFAHQVQKDLTNFDMVKSLNTIWWQRSKFNLKRVLYRSTTIFLSIIADFHDIKRMSSFDIIEELAKKNIVNEDGKRKLEFAISIACEARLKAYLMRKRQDDWIALKNTSSSESGNEIRRLIDFIGAQSIVEYCETACQLQDYVRKIILLDSACDPLTLDLTDDNALRAEICCALRLSEQCIELCENELELWDPDIADISIKLRLLNLIGMCYVDLKQMDKALACFQERLVILERKTRNTDMNIEVVNCLVSLKSCLGNNPRLKQVKATSIVPRCASEGDVLKAEKTIQVHHQKKLSQHITRDADFEQGLTLHKQISLEDIGDVQVATSIGNIGICVAGMHKYENAMEHFKQEAKIRKRVTAKPDVGLAICYRNMSMCMKETKNYAKAVKYLKKELEIREKLCKTEDNDIPLTQCLKLLTICQIQIQNYNPALDNSQVLLKLQQRRSSNEPSDVLVADCLHLLSLCYINTNQRQKGIETFRKELDIRTRLSKNQCLDHRVSHCRCLLGVTLTNLDWIHEETENFYHKRKSVF